MPAVTKADPQKVQKRIKLMQSGFRKYISIRSIPLDAETKWSLEVVSLTSDYKIPDNYTSDPSISIQRKGKLYTIQTVQNFCAKLNASKAEWVEIMKS